MPNYSTRVLSNRRHKREHGAHRRARLESLEDRCLLALTSLIDESSQVSASVQTDGSLGTTWTGGDELFNDSSWATSPPGGPNGVGYERGSGYEPFIGIDVESAFFGNVTSVYIRIPFNKEAIQSLDTLTLNMRYDDGFVAYLNGVRVASSPGAPANPVWNSQAPSHDDTEAVIYQPFDIAAFIDIVEDGNNILAIHGMNTTTNSSDALFQATLVADFTEIVGPTVYDDPEPGVLIRAQQGGPSIEIDILANDGDTGDEFPIETNSVELTQPGSGASVVWDPVADVVLYTPSDTFDGTSDLFTYRVREASPQQLFSRLAVVTVNLNPTPVVPDTNLAVVPGSSVEFDLAANFTDPGGWTPEGIGIDLGSAQVIGQPSLGEVTYDAVTGVFTYTHTSAEPLPLDSFEIEISDLEGATTRATVSITVRVSTPAARDDDYEMLQGTTLRAGGAGGDGEESLLVPRGSTWNYLDTGSNQGTAWRAAAFDDASWASGPAQLGYGDGDEATVVARSGGSSLTTYFRRSFLVENSLLVTAATVRLVRDDGAAVYLNGVEIVRDNLPSGAGFQTAASAVVSLEDESAFFEFDVDPSLLVEGTNVLAVEVHQLSSTSSDVSFDLELGVDVLAASGVLFNDTDADGDALTVLLVDGPQNGTLDLQESGAFTYTPDPTFSGTDTFTYSANDGLNLSPAATVTILVTPFNHPPVAGADAYDVDEDQPLDVDVDGGLLANDTDGNGDSLIAQLMTGPNRGVVTIEAEGSFTYFPDDDFNGEDTFTYRAFDGELSSPQTTVTITVNSVDDPPVALDDAYQVIEGGVLDVSFGRLIGGDSPASGSILLPVPASKMFYDNVRNILYARGDQEVLRYDVVAGEVLEPIFVGRTLKSGDITPDASALYFTDSGTAPGVGFLQKVNLDDLSVERIAFNRGSSESYSAGLAIGADGVAIFSTRYQGSGGTPVRRLDTATDTVIGVVAASWYMSTAFYSGAGKQLILAVNRGTSRGTIATVSGVGSEVIGGISTWTFNRGVFGTANRDGSLVAMQCCGGVSIRSANLNTITTLTGWSNGGLAFDPVKDIMYIADAAADQLVALDSNNWQELFRLYIGEDISSGDNRLITSANGQYLFLSTPSGTRMLDIFNVPEVVVPAGSKWKFLDDGSDQGTAWRERGFNDFFWSEGPAVLGYGQGDRATRVSFGNDPADKHATTYFRRTLEIDDPDRIDALEISLLADDGAAVYLNGVEIIRDNLATAAGADQFAISPSSSGQMVRYQIDPQLLRQGENLLAVEVHGSGPNDSGLSFDMQVSVDRQRPAGVLSNDADVDLDPLTAELAAGPQNGTLVLNSDGTFRYTPDDGFTGSDTFTYRASAGGGVSQIATVTIEVLDINRPPEADNDSYRTDEEQTLTVLAAEGVLNGDLDSDGEPITAIVTGPPRHGQLTLQSDGSLTYEPDRDFNGVDAFTYQASDGTNRSNTATVTITVDPVNDAPVAVDDVYVMDKGTVLELGAPPVGPPEIAGTSFDEPAVGAIDFASAGGELGYSSNGTVLSDDMGVTSGGEFRIHQVESPFTVTLESVDVTGYDQTTVRIDARSWEDSSGSDFEDEDYFRVRVQLLGDDLPPTEVVLLDRNGTTLKQLDSGEFGAPQRFSADLPEGYSTATLIVEAQVNSSSERVFFDNIQFMGTPRGEDNGLLSNDRDVDGDPLSVTLVAPPEQGELLLNADGSLVFTPQEQFVGTVEFTYQVNDGNLDSNAATVTINVMNANLIPSATGDAYATDEDTPLTVDAGEGLLDNDSDGDGETLTAVLVSGPTQGTLDLQADGSFTYTPGENFFGDDAFTYRATDGRDLSAETTVSITIASVNDAPLAVEDVYAVDEGETLVVGAAGGGELVLGPGQFVWDVDAGGNGHVYEIVTQNTNWQQASTAAANMTFAGTPGHLATITSQAELDFLQASGVTSTEFVWLGGYQDTSAPDYSEPAGGWRWVTGEPWSFTSWGSGEPNNVGAENFLQAGNELTWWNDASSSRTGPIFLVEYPINTDGVLIPETTTIVPAGSLWKYLDDGSNQGTAWREPAFGDASWPAGPAELGYGDGDEATVVRRVSANHITTYFRHEFELEDLSNVVAAGLGLVRDDGAVVYLNGVEIARENLPSNPNYQTLATNVVSTADESRFFSFDVEPELFVEGTNVLAVEIHQANTTSSDISFDLRMTIDVVSQAGVLANDTDVEDDDLTAQLVTEPSNGVVVFDLSGTFTYTPDDGFSGVDQFTYTANDAQLASSPTLVTLNVGDANMAPTSAAAWYTTRRDDPLRIPADLGLLTKSRDLNRDPLTLLFDQGPSNGVLEMALDGGFLYTPTVGFQGIDTFAYYVSDGQTNSSPAEVTIDVVFKIDPLNSIPISGDDLYEATVGTTLSVDGGSGVLENDVDPEGGALEALLVEPPLHGTLSLAGDGSFEYTPLPGYALSDQFAYRATDGNTASNVAIVTIQMVSPPAPIANSIPRSGIASFFRAYGAESNMGEYNSDLDFNSDGMISLRDISWIRNLLRSPPSPNVVAASAAIIGNVWSKDLSTDIGLPAESTRHTIAVDTVFSNRHRTTPRRLTNAALAGSQSGSLDENSQGRHDGVHKRSRLTARRLRLDPNRATLAIKL